MELFFSKYSSGLKVSSELAKVKFFLIASTALRITLGLAYWLLLSSFTTEVLLRMASLIIFIFIWVDWPSTLIKLVMSALRAWVLCV